MVHQCLIITPSTILFEVCLWNVPPVCKLVPSWDLFQMLDTLSRAPFEPMGSASLFHLSIKVVFLMAVAMARRRSELHSLTVEDDHIRWGPGGVRLIPRAGFLTKNQSSDFSSPEPFLLPT